MIRPKHPDWSGATATVIASGPSLTAEQCKLATQDRTIMVNSAYTMLRWASVYYAGDFLFWKTHSRRMPDRNRWTVDSSAAEQYGCNRWPGRNVNGLGEEYIALNGNSGAQAINLAYLFGARKILLLGFTMREIDGKKHFHGDHEAPLVQTQQFPEWIHRMGFVAKDAERLGCDIVNCDPLSALQCFRRGQLEDEICSS